MLTNEQNREASLRRTSELLKKFQDRNRESSSGTYSAGDIEFKKSSIDKLIEDAQKYNEAGQKLRPYLSDIVDIAKWIANGKSKSHQELANKLAVYTENYKNDPKLGVTLEKICADNCLGVKNPEDLKQITEEIFSRFNEYKGKKYEELAGQEDWVIKLNEEFINVPYFINQNGWRFYPNTKTFAAGGKLLKTSEGWSMSIPAERDYLNKEAAFINRQQKGLYFYPSDGTYYNSLTNETSNKFPKIEAETPNIQAPINLPTGETGSETATGGETNAASDAALRVIEDSLTEPRKSSEDQSATLSSEELSRLTYMFEAFKNAKGERVEISKVEWKLLQRLMYVYVIQSSKDQNWLKEPAKFDEIDGLEEQNNIKLNSKGAQIYISEDYIKYAKNIFSRLQWHDENGPSSQERANAAQENSAADLAELRSASQPESEVPVTHQRTDVPELRVPEPRMFDTAEAPLADMNKLQESPNPVERGAGNAMQAVQEEASAAQGEIARAVPAIKEVSENTIQIALKRLDALGYRDPNKVLQPTDQRPKDEEIPVPEFLKPKVEAKNGWREKLFGQGSKVGDFIEKVKKSRAAEMAKLLRRNKTKGGAMALLLLTTLGLNWPNENKKSDAAPEIPAITNPEQPNPESGNPQIFDDVPNPYPPVFEGQTIYPEVPNVSVPEIGTPDFSQYTKITPELRKECQAGNFTHMIGCIKAVVGAQTPEVRQGLVKMIAEAAEKRADSEGVTWSKLNKKEKDTYIDAVLGGTQDKTTNSITKTDSPASAIAKHYGLNVKDITFTGADGLSKMGIDAAKFKTPESLDQKVIVDMIVSQLKK